jgi:hypothetical protein
MACSFGTKLKITSAPATYDLMESETEFKKITLVDQLDLTISYNCIVDVFIYL